MDHAFVEVLVLLGAALVLGTIAEKLRQSAMLGYLVAGTLVGPNVLGWVKSGEHVHAIAELGVALLLFTIGLEFSFSRLRRLGKVALVGGTLQVGVTMGVAALVAMIFGLDWRAAVAIGAMLALSSTACVLRLLTDRAAVDSLYGRNSLGILLMQDVAVIPLVLLFTLLGTGGTLSDAAITLGKTVGLGALLIVAFLLLFRYVIPRILNLRQLSQNRELPILLAIVMAVGSAVAAHSASLSPAMGAFVAGVLLGESPFAVQIRADVASIRTVLVTLFFVSVGMLGEPVWVMQHALLVGAVVLAIIVGKTLIVAVIIRAMRSTSAVGIATGLCLAQVGEFSFVLADIGRGKVFDEEVFKLIVSATILTLFVTPFLVMLAPKLSDMVAARTVARSRKVDEAPAAEAQADAGGEQPTDQKKPPPRDMFIIGFGPAGQQAMLRLLGEYSQRLVVMELNPRNTAMAERCGLAVQVGDATNRDVLEHAHLERARVILVTVPDPKASRTIIQHCKSLAPHAAIIARGRYHMSRAELQAAGAYEVVDEEQQVGLILAEEAERFVAAPPVPKTA